MQRRAEQTHNDTATESEEGKRDWLKSLAGKNTETEEKCVRQSLAQSGTKKAQKKSLSMQKGRGKTGVPRQL